jgi:hypothetical protein
MGELKCFSGNRLLYLLVCKVIFMEDISPRLRYPPTRLHRVTTEKTTVFTHLPPWALWDVYRFIVLIARVFLVSCLAYPSTPKTEIYSSETSVFSYYTAAADPTTPATRVCVSISRVTQPARVLALRDTGLWPEWETQSLVHDTQYVFP